MKHTQSPGADLVAVLLRQQNLYNQSCEIESQCQSGMSFAVIPLPLLRSHEAGVIRDIAGSDADVTRLAEMGLRVGTVVRMVQPGQPCLIAVEGRRLTFRGGDSDEILVELCEAR
jgi:Fe2+ transport system protein FeoA